MKAPSLPATKRAFLEETMPPDPPRPSEGGPPFPGEVEGRSVDGLTPGAWPSDAAPLSPPPVPPSALPGEATLDDIGDFDFTPLHPPGLSRERGLRKPRVPSTPIGVEHWIVDALGAEEAAEFMSLSKRIRTRIDDGIRRSPPFTFSLCMHAAVLIVLALLFVRIDRQRRRPIELSFAAATVVEDQNAGVQVELPRAEPKPEPEPELMKGNPPVEEPVLAPEAAEAEQAVVAGSEPVAPTAPAVGSLLEGREAGRRERLVEVFGGSAATEAAVARALEWLVRQQRKDGLWSLQEPYENGASQENRLAATAMALLALQGAGNTPRVGIHKSQVAQAWSALLKKQVTRDEAQGVEEIRRSGAGSFAIAPHDPPERQALYAHAMVTIALCELYGMTKDPVYAQPARRAVSYALAAQGPNGGWRYEPGQNGDMSVTGWYVMALKSAEMAGLEVPAQAFEGVARFLELVAVNDGSRYGYRNEELTIPAVEGVGQVARMTAGPVTTAVSAEGLLCRQYLGWPRLHPALVAGVEKITQEKFLNWNDDKDVYAWYYITQVTHHLGGPAWERWNGRMKEVLPAVQVEKGRDRGSWDPAGDNWGLWGGRLFTTCFCTYMLEVYYRHLPLYGDAAVAH